MVLTSFDGWFNNVEKAEQMAQKRKEKTAWYGMGIGHVKSCITSHTLSLAFSHYQLDETNGKRPIAV